MSLAKAVSDSLKDHKCKKITLHKRRPIPYVPKKDCVKETVSSFKDQHLKTQIGKDTELQVLIWHSRRHEAFLMHMGSALEAIKKRGHFKVYKDANKAYLEEHNLVKLVKTALAELDGTTSNGTGSSRKSSKKPNETTVTASQPDLTLQAEYLSEIKQVQEAAEKAKVNVEQAALDMF
jgi:hypothetical protein